MLLVNIENQTPHYLRPKYRSDIDGLRAVAVLSVVGFHAFPEFFRGGYIGVDIFFVISGFLISSIIVKNLELNNFSFLEFYGRRIRRIFPALLLVLFSCAVAGWYFVSQGEYASLGKEVTGGAAPNRNPGWLDAQARSTPLYREHGDKRRTGRYGDRQEPVVRRYGAPLHRRRYHTVGVAPVLPHIPCGMPVVAAAGGGPWPCHGGGIAGLSSAGALTASAPAAILVASPVPTHYTRAACSLVRIRRRCCASRLGICT